MLKNVVVTGGSGRFGTVLKKIKSNYKVFFPDKKKILSDFVCEIRFFKSRVTEKSMLLIN